VSENVLSRVPRSLTFSIVISIAICLAAFTAAAADAGGQDFFASDHADVFCGAALPAFLPQPVVLPPHDAPMTVNVNISSFAFTPPSLTVNVGDTVMWTVTSGTHTTTSDTGVWNSGNLSTGNTFSFTFTSPGTFPYHCAIHTFMTASITVAAPSPTPTDTPTNTATNTPTPAQSLVINEIDYDQPGTDAAEFIELKNVSGGTINLDPVVVELINGAACCTPYQTFDLPNVNLSAGAYYVICGDNAAVLNCDLIISPGTNLIQNGAPDAVGLRISGTLVDAVSYEGDTGAPYTEGSGTGLTDDGLSAFVGISRFPDGADTNMNNIDLSARCVTPGAPNTSATTACAATSPTPTPSATFTPTTTPTATATSTSTATNTPTSMPTPSFVTSFDSALIAKHIISSPPLAGNKLGAAEVSGDCSVSSVDAAQIASYVTNNSGPIGTTGTTADPPGPCGMLPISTPVLMGDTSGTAPVTTAGSGSAAVSMPTVLATPADVTTVPIIVSDLTGLGVISYDIQITFDPSVASPNLSAPVSTSGTISDGMTLTTNVSNDGHLIISAYGDTALTGSGYLLALNFVTAAPVGGGTTALAFEDYTDSSGAGSHVHRGFLFNEGTPTVTLSNGRITLLGSFTPTNTPTPADTPSISGVVSYPNAAAPPKFIAGANVCANGTPTICTMTNSAGQYTLTGFGSGAYTLGVAKTTQINGISSNDAARIAQHVAGISLLTTNVQKISADVSGNGAVSSNDAAKIAQYVAGINPLPTPNLTATWRFFQPNPSFPIGSSPMTYPYAIVANPITNQDFWGILGGDVTGNWNPSGPPRPARGPEGSTAVELPNIVSSGEKEIVVPVRIHGAAGKEIISYEFNLRYDPSVIQPAADPVDLKATASRSLSYIANAAKPGILRIVMYGALPIDDSEVLLNLRFTPVGAPGSSSPLSLERLMFNEGEPRASTTDGQIELF
jgi:plastocyanin